MWTICPLPLRRSVYPHPNSFPSSRSALLLRKSDLAWRLLPLFLLVLVPLPGKGTDMTRQTTEATLSVASPDRSQAVSGDSRTFVTVTVSVRTGDKPVSPGSVLFCDAHAPICEDGALVGKA